MQTIYPFFFARSAKKTCGYANNGVIAEPFGKHNKEPPSPGKGDTDGMGKARRLGKRTQNPHFLRYFRKERGIASVREAINRCVRNSACSHAVCPRGERARTKGRRNTTISWHNVQERHT